jgi:pyruvate dehydrogenase E2 component (dihydrolipoamide acetyltransferase)
MQNYLMAEVIRMPLLSDTMKEGKIVSWLKKVGDEVQSDDVLAEVQTDKATMEVVPYVDGTILHIGIPEGEAAAVNQIIAIIGDEGEDFKDLLEDAPSANGEEGKEEASRPEENTETSVTAESPKVEKKELPSDLEVVRMPLLSDTMKQGKIVSWLKNVGDEVTSDDVLAEVETDKATMEVIGYADGTLLYQGVEAGNSVEVNGVLAIVGDSDTKIDEYLPTILAEAESKESEEPAGEAPKETVSKESEKETVEKNTVKADAKSPEDDSRIKASPLARSMAKEKGISLSGIQGTGDGGRIIKRDIDNYKGGSASMSGIAAFDASSAVESFTEEPVSQMREIIAQRLGESKFNAPHFYLKISVEMDDFLKVRKQINTVSDVKISIGDMLIKAVALSLTKHPAVNSSWLGDKIRTNEHVHIGSAVAIDEGLIVPVIKFAHQKSLSQIAEDANVLYEKARTGKLQPQEFSGNTFTISNLGMMGIDEFTAIINPPDACILAVGKTTSTAVVNDDNQVEVRQIMKLTLSCDHRVVDGAVGARFLQTLKDYIEQPALMLL